MVAPYVVIKNAPVGLNIRQLLNPLFFSKDRRHPDSKRQRPARIKAKAFKQALQLKCREVPRSLVPPPTPSFDRKSYHAVRFWLEGGDL